MSDYTDLVWPGNKVVWDPKELEEAWKVAHDAFYNFKTERESEYQDEPDRAEATFQEIGDELGISKVMALKVYKKALGKAGHLFKKAGVTLDSIAPDPDASYRYEREIHNLING